MRPKHIRSEGRTYQRESGGEWAVDISARRDAETLWNSKPCGALDRIDSGSLAYFDEVAAQRYAQQSWMHDYFTFESFRGQRVLEIGVGHGTDLMQFAAAGADCSGIDITDSHLELCARNFALRGFAVDLRKCDATAIDHSDGTFDHVYSFGVLHHIPEIERVLAEIHRVLKPGGTLSIAVYNRRSVVHYGYLLLQRGIVAGQLFRLGYAGLLSTIETGADGVNVKPYVRLYTRGVLRRLLETSGFAVEDLSVHQLEPAAYFNHRATRFTRPLHPWLESRYGWYVTAKATRLS